MTVDAASAIAQLTSLRQLLLSGRNCFTDGQLAQLSSLSRLTVLELSGEMCSESSSVQSAVRQERHMSST